MSRRLTFWGLLEEARYDIARQLLRETELTAVAIAAVLDYAEAPVFSRAFRRWSGTTPTAWRAAQGASEGESQGARRSRPDGP